MPKSLEQFTPVEVARRLGYTLAHVYSLMWTGRLAASKKAGRWSIPAIAVEERLRKREERDGR